MSRLVLDSTVLVARPGTRRIPRRVSEDVSMLFTSLQRPVSSKNNTSSLYLYATYWRGDSGGEMALLDSRGHVFDPNLGHSLRLVAVARCCKRSRAEVG